MEEERIESVHSKNESNLSISDERALTNEKEISQLSDNSQETSVQSSVKNEEIKSNEVNQSLPNDEINQFKINESDTHYVSCIIKNTSKSLAKIKSDTNNNISECHNFTSKEENGVVYLKSYLDKLKPCESIDSSKMNTFKQIDDSESILTIETNYSFINLLKSQTPFRSSSIVAKRYHSNFSPVNSNQFDETYHIISSLLADKIYQIYLEHNEKVDKLLERASILINQHITRFDGWDADLNDVWDGLLESIPIQVKNLITICKNIPGLNELTQVDLTNLVNNRLFDYFLIKHSPLLINGESYMMLPNQIQYTRKWMLRIIGEEMVDTMFDFANEFNSLKMTTKEIALMYPFILTVPDEHYKDPYTIASLNEYYFKALMYEFDLNRRNNYFVNRWKKVKILSQIFNYYNI